MFADDTSVIVSNSNLENFKNDISSFRQLDDWFKTNLLSLKYDKTQFIQFRTINSLTVRLDISYNDKYIIHDTNTRFLGITIDSSLSWKHHIEGLAIKTFCIPQITKDDLLCLFSRSHVIRHNFLGQFPT
jgi:hypothetical protein